MLEDFWLCYHRLRHAPAPPKRKQWTPIIYLWSFPLAPRLMKLLNAYWIHRKRSYFRHFKFISLTTNAHYFKQSQFPLSLSQDLANYLYPEQHYSGPRPPTLRIILISSSHLDLGLPCGLSLSVFSHQKFCMHFSFLYRYRMSRQSQPAFIL